MDNSTFNREYGVSPSYQWTNAAQINAGEFYIVNWADDEPTSKKYLPFNASRIINNSGTGINIYPNCHPSNKIFVPNGTIMTLDRQALPGVSLWKVEAVAGNAIIGGIIITNSKEAINTDSIVNRLFYRLKRFL